MSESWGVGREGEPRQAATSQGERENTPSAVFIRHSLWWRERRQAVQGKYRGGWRGGPHVVCVSGRLDLGGIYSLTMTKASRPRRARAGSAEGPG